MNAAPPARVTVENLDLTVDCRPGESFLDAAARAGLALATACSAEGRCRSCAVRVVSGKIPDITQGEDAVFSAEQMNMGWRRSCRMFPAADCSVHIPRRALSSRTRHLVSGETFALLPVDPVIAVRALGPDMPKGEGMAKWDALQQGLSRGDHAPVTRIDIEVLRHPDPALDQQKGRLKVMLRGGEVIGVGPHNSRLFGVAVDLGTTNMVAFLINLATGATMAAITVPNPQARFGADVVSRLTLAIRNEADRKAMQNSVVKGLNGLITDLCANAMISPHQVFDLVIVGNTAMHHLFAGLPVAQLGKAPFLPAVAQAMDVKARDLGLKVAPGAWVHLPGIIAGYVGSDHIAALLAAGDMLAHDLALVVDIGTNTEISLLESGRIISASCPSGPALEGGQISCGMSAAEGAIVAVGLSGAKLALKTIGDAPPAGLCGSGVLDVVAGLYRSKIMNARGRLIQPRPRVESHGGRLEFVLVKDGEDGQIGFSQADIRAVQLAKAAIRAGIDLLLQTWNRAETDIRQIVVTGAFGNHINLKSAITIGLLPDLPLTKFQQVGNAAGKGACLALASAKKRAEADRIAQNATYLELAGHKDFMRVFVGRMNFTAPDETPQKSAAEEG